MVRKNKGIYPPPPRLPSSRDAPRPCYAETGRRDPSTPCGLRRGGPVFARCATPWQARRGCLATTTLVARPAGSRCAVGQSPLPRRKRRALNGAVGRVPWAGVVGMQTAPESTPRKAGLCGVYAGVVTPRVDSVPPHGTSPLRGKHASRFVQSALPRRKRRALNGAVGRFPWAGEQRLKKQSVSKWP